MAIGLKAFKKQLEKINKVFSRIIIDETPHELDTFESKLSSSSTGGVEATLGHKMSSLLQEKLCEIQIQAPAPLKDFHYFTITKTEQVQSIFGKSMLKYTLSLCQGHYDFLVRMPENLIIHIMSFLNVEDIEHLSKTCKKFQQLCNTDEFWERIKKLQNNFTLDLQSTKIPAYEKQRNFHQRKG
ncbi:F-box only protein 36, partial [Ophiophagus hannah]